MTEAANSQTPTPRLLLELEALKQHLLQSVPGTPLPLPPSDSSSHPSSANGVAPTVTLSADHAAIMAAVRGLEQEAARLKREEKLKIKFAATNAATASSASSAGSGVVASGTLDEAGYVKMSKADVAAATSASATGDGTADDDMDLADEWQEASPDVAIASDSEEGLSARKRSECATRLAADVVSRIAKAGTAAASPLGALALAFHAALLSLGDEFKCTGLPEKKGGGGGFAAPVRELPRGMFVPKNWEGDGKGDEVVLRYKNSGTVYLRVARKVASANAAVVEVTVSLSENQDSSNGVTPLELTFPLGEHVNLDGWRVAASTAPRGSVSPSLFYVSLSSLLEEFGKAFDLNKLIQCAHGTEEGDQKSEDQAVASATDAMVVDEKSSLGSYNAGAVPSVAVVPPATARVPVRVPVMTSGPHIPRPMVPPNRAIVDEHDPLRISTGGGRRGGDFDGDLLPGGPRPGIGSLPGFANPYGGDGMGSGGMGIGGSHVGPNHPIFDRTFGDDNGTGDYGLGGWDDGHHPSSGVGGNRMRPRFDPYGPPSGPTDPGRGRMPGRGGRGRGGRGVRPGRPGGSGDPNPDHMRPPNDDYFS